VLLIELFGHSRCSGRAAVPYVFVHRARIRTPRHRGMAPN
jgi:hypothetical protein